MCLGPQRIEMKHGAPLLIGRVPALKLLNQPEIQSSFLEAPSRRCHCFKDGRSRMSAFNADWQFEFLVL
jgi:hypothetical protein